MIRVDDIFENKLVTPMLIGESSEAFDSEDYIFELKLDGIRCIAYLDEGSTELRNKRNLKVNNKYPELMEIHKQVKKSCILDGEVIITKDGKPHFSELQRRAHMSNDFKIKLHSAKFPASFVAYDILYLDGELVTDLPLMDRKRLLEENVVENESLAISRYIEREGKKLYELTVKEELEGVIAKLKDSKYYFGKRTKDWIKIKNLQDDDFVVCGYIEKADNVISLILGQYLEGELTYIGHVTMGVNREDFNIIKTSKKIDKAPFPIPKGNENAIWIEPSLVCRIEFMNRTKGGGLRQPVFRGLRDDKRPEECVLRT